MDSDSATSPSPPPPLPPAVPQDPSYPDSEETLEPEDYETASEPGVNDSDSPEKTSLKSSPETGNRSASTEDDSGIRGSTRRGDLSENSDSAGKSNGVGLGFGEMDDAFDTDDGVEAAGEKAVNGSTGETRELEAKELDEALVMQPKVREFGVLDSAPNEKAAEEVEPKVVESESSVAAVGEVEGDAHKEFSASVGDNEKFVNLDEVLPADGDVLPSDGDVLPADGDVLEDNHGGEVEPEDVEVKFFESPAVDATDVEKCDTGHQLGLVMEDEKQPENLVEAGVVDEVVSKASVGEDNLLKGDAPEFDSIDSNDEIARENLVESSEIVKSEPSKSSADDLEQGNCSEISDKSPVEGEIAADDGDLNSTEEAKNPSDIPKESLVNSADDLDQGHYGEIGDRSPVDGEITADDGDLNSGEEAKTPDITEESAVGDENTRGTTTGMAHEKSEDDKPDEVNLSYVSEGRTPLSEGIANEKVEVGSEHVSGPLNGENEVDAEDLPVVAKETAVEDDNTGGIDVLDDTPNQEISEVVGSEHVSGHVEDEAELKLTADDGDLKSAEEEETLPIVPKEAIVGNENIEETTDGSTDTLLNQESGENKLVPGLENDSGVRDEEPAPELTADGGDLNTAEEVKNVPVVPEETVVGDENIEETVNRSTDKHDGASLNQEVGDGKLVSGSENASGDGDGEPVLQLTEHDDDLNSTEEVNTVPVIPIETVVEDEKIEQSTNVSLPLNSDTDKLESTLDREIGEGDLVIGSNHASHGEDKPTEEAVVGDKILPPVPELGKMVEPDAGESQISVAEEENDGDEEEEEDGRVSDGPAGAAILNSSEAAQQYIRELERISSSSQSGLHVDGQIVTDSDEAGDSDEDGEGGEMFDSTALAALLRAATSSSDGTVTVTAQDAARIFSVDRPVGLGTSAPSLRPAASRFTRPGLFTPSEIATVEEPDSSMDDDERRLHEKVEEIRVKFLRLVYKLGHSPDDAVAGQVLYRLSLAEGIKRGRQTNRAFSIETAKKRALQLEAEGKDDLNFSCNIMVIGKTGVGKSATINSIFGEERSQTNPFQLTTTSVREVCGVVDGVRVRVLDTPGLKPSIMDQAANRKILSSIKKSTKKCPPDIVLYVDRMDTQTRDFNDLPLLKSITSVLGSSIWFNAIVALTHAASAPPDGPNGSPLGYDVFVSQRSHVVQQSIRQAAGDMRLMNPVALVENHPSCRRNREGERVLPNGLSWRPQLLLLSYASKILSEANSLLKLQDPSSGKLFGGFRLRSPPLPFLLSSLLQARPHPKLSGDQGGDNADSDVDLDEFSDAEQDEEVDEYDQLPPFKPLRKSQIAMLSKEQKRAYLDEYDYRVKLLQKKQWKEELRRLKEAKKKGKGGPAEFPNGDMPDDYDQENGPAAVQVPLPDMVLPPSFDCDNPAFRYRFLEPTSQLLTRPVLDTHGWDHDCGYDGVNIEENLAIAGRFPTSMAVQITKDKKEFNIHLDSSVAVKHGEHGSTVAGFDIQSVGKQLAYILRGETKFDSVKKNKTAAGVSVTFLGETVATGLKVEDRISISKRLGLVASTGAVRAQGDVAYGANLEVRVRDKDYPIGQALSTLGLSLMKWRSDLALGANLQSQFSVGRNSKMAVRVGLNNKLTGQITVRTSTSDQFQIALAGIIPLAVHIFRTIKSNESFMDH